jgi:hypothetical protein
VSTDRSKFRVVDTATGEERLVTNELDVIVPDTPAGITEVPLTTPISVGIGAKARSPTRPNGGSGMRQNSGGYGRNSSESRYPDWQPAGETDTWHRPQALAATSRCHRVGMVWRWSPAK